MDRRIWGNPATCRARRIWVALCPGWHRGRTEDYERRKFDVSFLEDIVLPRP